MLDLSAYNVRNFEVKVTGAHLNLLPPKMKHIKKLNAIAKQLKKNEDLEGITDIVRLILERNDKNRKFDDAFIDKMSYVESKLLIQEYMKWVNSINKNPNSASPSVHQQSRKGI